MNIQKVASNEIDIARLDADFYQVKYLENSRILNNLSVGLYKLDDISYRIACGPFGSNLPSSLYRNFGVPLYRVQNVQNNTLSEVGLVYLDKPTSEDLAACIFYSGDLLIAKSGNLGRVCNVPLNIEKCNVTQDVIGVSLNTAVVDKHYVSAYFNSKFGFLEISRNGQGNVQQHLNMPNVRDFKIPKFNFIIQKYIGDKVRQAELLRNLSGKINKEIYGMIACGSFVNVMQTEEKKYGLATLLDLSNRLDPKYYATKAIAAERFTKDAGVKLQNLISNISNGFEERNFVQQGQIYLTVSEVSSGRIEVKSAPKISFDVEVPSKAFIKQTCVLVVRTGSIGTAVKVHALDNKAVISSHLIRLEFKEESVAAAVAIFLNSSVGKILLHKISYGAVQPQIGQDELLNLHIPDYVLEIKEKLLESLNQYEIMIRFSQVLIQISKILVESLIEGNITEEELIKAQNALEQGDKSLDRAILSQMTEDGYAVAGSKPLFSDLDEFYDLLEQAKALE